MSLSLFTKPITVGVDLGHHSVKVMQIERSSEGWKITRTGTALTPANTMRDGIVTDPTAMAEAIKQAMRAGKIAAKMAHISVSGPSVTVRNVRMPQMPDALLRKSIKFEAGRYVPNSPEDSYIEFEILGAIGDGQMEVIMVAAPRDMVDSRVLACRVAGLDVDGVDIESFCSFRSLIEANHGVNLDAETVALMDIGFASTKVSVVSRGSFAMARTISQGGLVLTDALQKYFRLAYEDAEEGKAQLDVRQLLEEGKPTENPPLRVIQPHLDDLIRETRRSLNYYQSQQSELGTDPVGWVLLTGGGAKLQGIAEYMSAKLGLPVYSAGIIDNPRFTHLGESDLGPGAELSVVSGLAMRTHAKAA